MSKSDINTFIGDFGVYQLRIVLVVFLWNMISMDSIQIVFIGADMPHWCRVPELDDLPYDVQKNVAIPAQSTDSLRDGSYVEYSSCEMFSLNYSVYNRSQFYSWNRSLMIVTNHTSLVHCSQWTYDQSQFISTIVSKYNLVCGWSFLVQFASTAYMAGALVGSFTSGACSDRFGRKKTTFSFSVLKVVGMLMSVFSATYWPFVVGRFLIGCSEFASYLTTFVLVMELVGRRYRRILGALIIPVSTTVGYMRHPLFAYFLRDSASYQLAASGLNFLYPLVILLVIPESPRWLAVHARYDEVTGLLRKMCRANKRELPADFDATCLVDELHKTTVKSRNCSSLLTSATLRLRTIVVDIAWFTCGLIYYALSFNTGELHGNIYINTFIAGAVEIPAYTLCMILVDWKPMGRRWTGSSTLIVAAISSFLCILMLMLGYHVATVTFSMLGKLFISITFSCIYVHSSELFPTEVRSVGVGTASMCARISSMAAAYVGGPLALVWKPLPSLVFGVLCTISGLLYMLLPETLGQLLPDTIEEFERFTRRSRKENRTATEVCAKEPESQANRMSFDVVELRENSASIDGKTPSSQLLNYSEIEDGDFVPEINI